MSNNIYHINIVKKCKDIISLNPGCSVNELINIYESHHDVMELGIALCHPAYGAYESHFMKLPSTNHLTLPTVCTPRTLSSISSNAYESHHFSFVISDRSFVAVSKDE